MTQSEATRYARTRADDGTPFWVVIEGEDARRLTAAPWAGGVPAGPPARITTRLCPVTPSKIIGIGRNYRAHAAEMGQDVPSEPLLFLKPPSSLLDPGGTIELPPQSAQVEHEGELGVVIGMRCRHVRAEHALEYVLGYTAVCDVTARDLQKQDGQWTRAKGFDGFCPVGPEIVCGIDVSDLRLQVTVNGQLRQDGRTRDMIFGVAELVSFASSVMTLEPGDLISTGTPHGISPIRPGDSVAVAIDSIGTLTFQAARSA